jgi:hypothetical protein
MYYSPMRHRLLLTTLALTACVVPAPAPSGPPPSALAEQEPVSFLLERAQRLGLPDSVTTQLARLNLRLFGRNRPLQVQIDTLLARPGERARPDPERMPPEVRARVDTLLALIRQNSVAAKDTAWAMLTEAQRARADSMLAAVAMQPADRRGAPGGQPPR